jgi:hypothetical protein
MMNLLNEVSIDIKIILDMIKDPKNREINTIEDLKKDSDQCLVVLTESPTCSIKDWASRTYKIDSSIIKKMVKTGYHTDKEWEVIIF